MFDLTGKSFKRKDVFYLTLKVEADEKIISNPRHEIHVRPQYIQYDGGRLSDPKLGRSDDISVLATGEPQVIKIQVQAQDLLGIDGEGTYTLVYGVVQEFVKWHEPLVEIVLNVKASKTEEVVKEAIDYTEPSIWEPAEEDEGDTE